MPLGQVNDAAAVVTLAPGGYTIHVNSAGPNIAGVGLMEIYDADPPSGNGPRLANVSTRGYVGADAEVLIGGFVISGSSGKNVLVRGIGPGLRGFGVGDAVSDPVLTIFQGAEVFATNDNWGDNRQPPRIVLTSQQVGAFELAENSLDAAIVLYDLPPGTYTAQLSGRDGATGVGLLEIYELP